MSREEAERFLARTDLAGYQRVPLGYGLEVPGSDREPSFCAALPASLRGKTVLDAGCAYGAISFLAEEAGARHVLGVDKKATVIGVAREIGRIRGSNVEFWVMDVDRQRITRRFDIVLCYNVIHHLLHPLWALQNLADATRELLVLEFSTLRGRFLKLSRVPPRISRVIENYPMISPTIDEAGLCFSPKAMEIVLNWFGKFDLVLSQSSPKQADYALMVFRRGQNE